MSQGEMIAILVGGMTLLMLLVGWIGNKVVDKTSDAVHNRAVRRQTQEAPAKQESLAERLEKGRKL